MAKVAVVTGSSSGIGYEVSLALAKQGYTTYATMRDASRGDKIFASKKNIIVKELDVDSRSSIDTAMDEIIAEQGRIDVLVNNAGYMIFGTIEDLSMDELRQQFETNFFGVASMIQKTIPVMRRGGGGHIINMSSVVGRIGFPGTPAYISSKFALEGFSESLRYELEPDNIKVILIEPGVVSTRFFHSMKLPSGGLRSSQDKTVSESLKMMAEMGTSPSEVAQTIIAAIDEDDPQLRYPVGQDAIMFLNARNSHNDEEFEKFIKEQLAQI